MKPRHAAALALVGWYLMMPPLMPPPGRRVAGQAHMVQWTTAAPLRDWLIVDIHDSASECRNGIKDHHAIAVKTGGPEVDKYVDAFQCIAADDPRLKSK
jgi:hypothetical protein